MTWCFLKRSGMRFVLISAYRLYCRNLRPIPALRPPPHPPPPWAPTLGCGGAPAPCMLEISVTFAVFRPIKAALGAADTSRTTAVPLWRIALAGAPPPPIPSPIHELGSRNAGVWFLWKTLDQGNLSYPSSAFIHPAFRTVTPNKAGICAQFLPFFLSVSSFLTTKEPESFYSGTFFPELSSTDIPELN